MGVVLRCSNCATILLRAVRTPYGRWLEMRGAAASELVQIEGRDAPAVKGRKGRDFGVRFEQFQRFACVSEFVITYVCHLTKGRSDTERCLALRPVPSRRWLELGWRLRVVQPK